MSNAFRLTALKAPNDTIAKNEKGLSTYLPWSHLVSPTLFATHDGALGGVISVLGLPFEVSEDLELARHHQRLSALWQSLPEHVAVYVTQHRHQKNDYPVGEFPEGFTDSFNAAYQEKFSHKALYVNDLYLTFILKDTAQQGSKKGVFFKNLFPRPASDLVDKVTKQAQQLEHIILKAMVSLSDYSPTRLGHEENGAVGNSRLLRFLSLLVNGESNPVAYPASRQNLSRYLPKKQVNIGLATLEFKGNATDDHRLGALLSVKSYQNVSHTKGLKALLGADFEFISTHIFTRLPKNTVVEAIRIQLGHLEDAEDAALSQQDALEEARDGVASDFVGFGTHQHTLLIFGKTSKALDHSVAEATAIYSNVGLNLVRERLNLEAGFFSQMPGNFAHIRRGVPVSSDNFADYAPLHNYHTGYIHHNHLGSAVMLLESQGRTPLYFNWHKRGSANNPPLGHSLILGPSDAGKTVLLGALSAMTQKYHYTYSSHGEPHRETKPPMSFYFDRNGGLKIYILACGGFYSDIKPGVPTGFNPLQLEDTPQNRVFLIHWFSTLLVGDGSLTDEAKEEVERLINKNFTLDKSQRRLSIVRQFLPIDFAYHKALKPWCQGGSLAYLFDNPEDTLDLSHMTMAGFNMTHLLSVTQKGCSSSVLDYLFHRIKQTMDGRLISLTMEEVWQFLEHPYWINEMNAFLPDSRKNNLFLVFVGQSAEKILSSPLRSYITENTATQLFLPNDKAKHADYVDGFELTEGQVNFIQNAGNASRSFLFRQGKEVAVGRLNLTGLEDYIRVFSGNENTVRLCDEIRAEVGNDPKQWLPLFISRSKK